MSAEAPLQPEGVEIGAVLQPTIDYHVERDKVEYDRLSEAVRKFRSEYIAHNFSKGDKLPSEVFLRNHRITDRIELEIPGGIDTGWFYRLDISLAKPFEQGKSVSSTSDAFSLIGTAHPGGNAFNEVRNLAHFMEANIGPAVLHVYSSRDETFNQWYDTLSQHIRDRIHLYDLCSTTPAGMETLAPRRSYHLDYAGGTISVAKPSARTVPYMQEHFNRLLQHAHVIVSEPYGREISGAMSDPRLIPNLKYNPSSAFLGECAVDVFEVARVMGQASPGPVVTMNTDEFDYFVRRLEERMGGSSSSLLEPEVDAANATEKKNRFKSPFGETTWGSEVSQEAVAEAGTAFLYYLSYVPCSDADHLRFTLNVSDGRYGGFHLAKREKRWTVVYSTTPSPQGSQLIIDTVNNPAEVNRSNTRVMGAGDSLGATLSLANIWDVEKLMHCYAKESNIKSPNKELVATAGIVFVSLFSRYIGECAYRSKECDICDIPVENVRPLMDRAAKEAWQTARELWTYSAKPGVALTETTGIRVAIWELEQG